ncbi:DUF2147 domain-containing protein [Arsenicitalea aurantiaca]|uniref:DUF2147 domain-containing protein n=1 Tax=Arsenicitalea aurantiaca TaxID=1783274 RepID=A0A433X370_9HYPH|nr:DUF2147 domain-containing protein [Arsenicitalea aurantiaca]RUT28513.1 DUF2147 domain-containing protein [Arsenicitalea aurantiaca]
MSESLDARSAAGWRTAAAAVAVMAPLALGEAKAQQSVLEGVWMTVSQSELTIAPCPEGYCGHISRIVVPEHIIAQYGSDVVAMESSFTDALNKDPALRNRPIMGLRILTLRPGRQAHIFDGEIYNPEDGNTYSGYVEVLGPDVLKLNGCILYNIICRGEEWVRIVEQ